jgi:hypothetical protein
MRGYHLGDTETTSSHITQRLGQLALTSMEEARVKVKTEEKKGKMRRGENEG